VVDNERRARVVVEADPHRAKALEVVLGQRDLLTSVGEHRRAGLLARHEPAGGRGRPEERVAAGRSGAELEEHDALLALDEELDAQRVAELVGKCRLFEDDHGLGVAARAPKDRAVWRDPVAESDRAVEAPGRAGEQALGVSDGGGQRRSVGQREGKRPKRRLAVEKHDRAHAQSLASASASRTRRRARRP
jgi:hypothetical protein